MRFVLVSVIALTGTLAVVAESPPVAVPVSFNYAGPYACARGAMINHTELFEVPAGAYGKVTLDMDVTAGPWYAANPHARFNIFWMVKANRNIDMLGYCALNKPGDSPQVMLRQGIGVPHPQKTKDLKDVAIAQGTTYHFNYRYDLAGKTAELVINEGDKEIARLTSVPLLKPSATAIVFAPGEKLTIGLSTAIGEDKPNAPEAPSFGWAYRNLRVTLYPAAGAKEAKAE